MSPRQQRVAELLAARKRIDANLRRLVGYNPAQAHRARQLVWDGMTHAEAAQVMGIPTDTVTRLIAWAGRDRQQAPTREEAA